MFAFLYFSQMTFKNASQLFAAFYKTFGYLFLLIILVLFIDSTYMSDKIPNNQHLATLITLIAFAILYYKSTSRLREQLIYAIIIGYVGEHLFSLGLGMYTYRLERVPHYVPIGHAIVLAAAFNFCKKSIVKNNRKLLEKFFAIYVLVYATMFLIFAGDVFGFIMSLFVIYFLRNKPRERLFYLSMHFAVTFLEITGTSFECWYWPEIAFDKFSFLKSANPPSGISLLYFLLDLGSLWLYKKRHKIAWERMKNFRKLRELH